tara:strand:- start:572 stop:868 length:297 start_codon:yes stop_codon:yes gene_type:complete
MKEFFDIYMSGCWKHFHNLGYHHGTLCRWKYTPSNPRPKRLWKLCHDVSEYWDLEFDDIIMEAIKSIEGTPCENLIRNQPSEKKSAKSEKKESHENKR